jgi:hypothetical protein
MGTQRLVLVWEGGAVSEPNACLWCGRDCSFMATCEGVCLYCGDKMQALPVIDLIRGFAKAVRRVQELEHQLGLDERPGQREATAH